MLDKSFIASNRLPMVTDDLLMMAMVLLIAILIVLLIFKALKQTFNLIELFLILLCPLVGLFWEDTSIEMFAIESMVFRIDIIGAAIPMIVGAGLLIRSFRKIKASNLILTVIVVALSTYATTDLTSDGVIAYFPLYLIPPITATIVSFMVSQYPYSGRLAFSSSVFGVLIGADLIRIWEIADYNLIGTATIGGAGVSDMIFISGILAVLMSSLLVPFKRKKPEVVHEEVREE